jgi:hypothetical protein
VFRKVVAKLEYKKELEMETIEEENGAEPSQEMLESTHDVY